MKNWADLSIDQRRAVLQAVRDASADLLPLLWQAYDGAPDARWRKRAGAVLERLRACDLNLNEVPATLYYLPWHVEALERFATVKAWRGDKARRERARVLLQLVSLGDGLALCDGENLLEVEAVKERAAADVAAARADVAAARGDLANERTRRAEAQAFAAKAEAHLAELQATRRDEKRASDLLEGLEKKTDTLLQRSEALPVLVHNAEVAMDTPLQMAREIRELASSELSRDAMALFFELENGLSVNAAAKKLKIPRQTLDRRLHDEIEPFRERHNLPAPGKGKHRIIPFPSNT